MKVEDAIVKLAEGLDEWFEEGRSAFAVPDRFAQGRAIERGIKIVQTLDRLKEQGIAAIKAKLADANSAAGKAQVASLVDAFAFASRLADTLHDELLDTDGEMKSGA